MATTTINNQSKLEFVPTGIKFKMKILINNDHVANLVRTGKEGDTRFSYLVLTPHVWGKGWEKLVEFQATPETQDLVRTAVRTWILKKFC